MQRRTLLLAGPAAAVVGAPAFAAPDPAIKPFRTRIAQAKLNRIEADSSGRIGVCIFDTGSGRRI